MGPTTLSTHASRFAEAKRDLLDQTAKAAGDLPEPLTEVGGIPIREFLDAYFRHIPFEDLAGRDPVDLAGGVAAHVRLAMNRVPGDPALEILSPTREADGWMSTHTVMHLVTDDMPFLVDSVSAELTREGRTVHLSVHPLMQVERNAVGVLERVAPEVGPGQPEPDASGSLGVGAIEEAWIHVEIDRESDQGDLDELAAGLRRVLSDVRESVEDWQRMSRRAQEIAETLQAEPPPVPASEVDEAAALLRWLVDDNFTFLGYREYLLDVVDGEDVLVAVPSTGLGILRADAGVSGSFSSLPVRARRKAREPKLLVLTKANSRSTVHRPVYLDYVGVKTFDADGQVTGERRFLGLFTAGAYTQSVRAIPFLKSKLDGVLAASGYAPGSHNARDLTQFVETYPRDELFSISITDLLDVALEIQHMQERRQVRLFLHPDEYGRYVSCLVYLPRDRYSTEVRLKLQDILLAELGGESVDYAARVTESVLARLHFVVRLPRDASLPDVDVEGLEHLLMEAARAWEDDLTEALVWAYGDEQAATIIKRFSGGLSEAYKEDFSASTAVIDLAYADELTEPGALALNLYDPPDGAPGRQRFKMYRLGSPVSLSLALPILQRMGVDVVDERPYTVDRHDGAQIWIHDFGLQYPDLAVAAEQTGPDGLKERFQQTFEAVWAGDAESDGFNALVLTAGLTWREVAVLRAYAKYLRQAGSTFSQEYVEQALVANVAITGRLVELFAVRFDPTYVGDREAWLKVLLDDVGHLLDDVVSLDQDRILRSLLELIRATLRTNWFQRDNDGNPKAYVSFKLDPKQLSMLPLPRPRFEIWVYSPRVEGVHLRFGAVARGGLRWSDRREDFRTEVLGLVKAQAVKNAVIVPTGAKGGFVVKNPADPSDREAWLAEGVACYSIFIEGLLDLTDNRVGGDVLPPVDVVRHDGDDTYLVVAADKGTATFSDIANGIAVARGFWLGDAFASGGSEGYDHKAMGITARGAWESVKRHFRELGVNTQTEEFTVVGIGDMSGDVFGNGMLLSKTIRLVAAFDHRHVFLDPNPDAAAAWSERERLFALPRSSWDDYDRSLISEGGGVYARSAKAIEINETVRAVLGIDADIVKLTPNELIHAILAAPVDLLWNGGIGTYVKSSRETSLDVGDKANDAVRVNGRDLRAKVVGEGGNLGLTQLGRIEAALQGVLLNTDAIDNSAGVDTSDHEVNLKVLLDRLVLDGTLKVDDRNDLLESMTDEVAAHVLQDNYEQNILLGNARRQAVGLLPVHQRMIRELESGGHLDRAVEFLPTDIEIDERITAHQGLTSPELAVMAAYSKMNLIERLDETPVPDEPWFQRFLVSYFPYQVSERFATQLPDHPLRREIITMSLANDMINRGGITFIYRAQEETSADIAAIARAYCAAREVFDLERLWHEIEALDNQVPMVAQTALQLETRRLLDRGTRWFLAARSGQLDVGAEVERFHERVEHLTPLVPDLLLGAEHDRLVNRAAEFAELGAPADLAMRIAALLDVFSLLDVVQVADHHDVDPTHVAAVYFTLSERYAIDRLLLRITALPRDDRWQALARFALRSDLYTAIAGITERVIGATRHAEPEARVAEWEGASAEALARTRSVLDEVAANESHDIAPISVALRVLRNLVRST